MLFLVEISTYDCACRETNQNRLNFKTSNIDYKCVSCKYKDLKLTDSFDQYIPFLVPSGWYADDFLSQQYALVPEKQSLPNPFAGTAPEFFIPDECGYG